MNPHLGQWKRATGRGELIRSLRSGVVAQPDTYGEVFLENGRWYGTFRRGNYMFPIDEVSLLAPAPAPFVFCPPRRKKLTFIGD